MPTHRPWSRWRAAGIHLAVSVLLLGTAALLAMVFWYPPSLFHVSGVDRLLLVLTVVDVTVGPLLTLLVYRAGKPGLRLDLAVIALLQAGFFLYGAHVFYVGRPVFLAGAVDRFELVFANEIPADEWSQASPPYDRPGSGRPRLVGVVLPDDPGARSELLFEELSGRDAARQPRLYRPYPEVARQLLARSRAATVLRRDPRIAADLARALARLDRPIDAVRWLPLDSRRGSAVQVIDATTGEPLATLPADPWAFPSRAGEREAARED